MGDDGSSIALKEQGEAGEESGRSRSPWKEIRLCVPQLRKLAKSRKHPGQISYPQSPKFNAF